MERRTQHILCLKDSKDLRVTTLGLKLFRDLTSIITRSSQRVEYFDKRISLIESAYVNPPFEFSARQR